MNQQHEINTFGLIGTQAAYETGGEWLSQLIPYLEKNVQTVNQFFEQHLPKVRIMNPEGTYLMWLDFTAYISDDQKLEHSSEEKEKSIKSWYHIWAFRSWTYALEYCLSRRNFTRRTPSNQARFRNNQINQLSK